MAGEIEENISLPILNDDCLLEICKYLPVLEKIHLVSEVCPQLEDLIFRKYKKVDLFKWCCDKEIPKFFKEKNFQKIYRNIGRYVEDISVYGEDHFISRRINTSLGPPHIHLILASRCMPNLQKIELRGINYSCNQWLNYFRKMIGLSSHKKRLQREMLRFKNLKTLSLNECMDLPGHLFFNVSNISELTLKSTDIVNVKCLRSLSNLEFLTIDNCDMPEPIELLKENSKLKGLTLLSNSHKKSKYRSAEFLSAITNLKSLIYLHADCLKNAVLEGLVSLKYLTVNGYIPLLENILEKNQLKMLDIRCGRKIQNMEYELEELLVDCTNLKLLNLPSHMLRNLSIQHLYKKMHLKTFERLKIKCSENREYYLVFEVKKEFIEYFDTQFITKKIFQKMTNASIDKKRGLLLMDANLLNVCTIKTVNI